MIYARNINEYHTANHALVNGVCSPLELSELFGLPVLPNGGFFAYCLNNKVLYDCLHGAPQHPNNPTVINDPIFKAAVMEDMFVF